MSKITVKQDNLEQIMAKLTKASTLLSDVTGNAFSSIKGNELLSSGINKISENMKIMGQRASNTSSIISKQQDSFMTGEVLVADVMNEIEIPTDLLNVYSPVPEEQSTVSLNKNDGESVNNGSDTIKKDLEFAEGGSEESLGDITKGATLQQNLKFAEGGKEKALADITKGDTEEQSLKFKGGDKEEALHDITKGETLEQKLKFAEGGNEEALKDISGGAITEQSLEMANGGSDETLKDITKGDTLAQNLKFNDGGNEKTLEDITGGNLNEQSINFGVSGEAQNMGGVASGKSLTGNSLNLNVNTESNNVNNINTGKSTMSASMNDITGDKKDISAVNTSRAGTLSTAPTDGITGGSVNMGSINAATTQSYGAQLAGYTGEKKELDLQETNGSSPISSNINVSNTSVGTSINSIDGDDSEDSNGSDDTPADSE